MELDVFERRETIQNYWLNEAERLRDAAGTVWAAVEDESVATAVKASLGYPVGTGFLKPVAWMLAGLSLELLFKAVIISAGGKPPTGKGAHTLQNLRKAAAVALDESTDEGLLEILTHYVRWAGRYPTPKGRGERDQLMALKEKHLTKRTSARGMVIVSSNGALSWEAFIRIWSAARDKYVEHVPRIEP